MNKKWMVLPVILLAVFGLLMMGCDNGGKAKKGDEDNFTPVSSINMTSSQHLYLKGEASVEVTLTATTVPSNPTNKTIVWSLGADSTADGAAVTGGKASATGAGIIKVVATITNGKTASENFVKNFDINVYEGFPKLSITYGSTKLEAELTAVGGEIECSDEGYTFTKTANYEGSFVYFMLDLAELDGITDLSDIYRVNVDYEGVSGDLSYKEMALVASATEFEATIGGHKDHAVNKEVNIDGIWYVGPRTADTTTLDIWPNRAKEFDGETYFSIYINTESNTVFTISNVEFVKRTSESKFDAVEEITIVKNSFYSAETLTLSPTILPPYATGTDIVWSLGGGSTATNADVTADGEVSADDDGTVVVIATITNGKTETTDFTKEFTITVKEGSAPSGMSVDVGGTLKKNIAVTGVGGTTDFFVDDADDSITGVTFTKKASWQEAYVYFDLDLGEALANFATVTLKVKGLEGDLGYKRFALMAAKPTPGFPSLTSNSQVIANSINSDATTGDNIGPQLNLVANTGRDLTFTIDQAKVTTLGLAGETTVRFAIFYNANAGVIEYSEFAFIK